MRDVINALFFVAALVGLREMLAAARSRRRMDAHLRQLERDREQARADYQAALAQVTRAKQEWLDSSRPQAN